VPCWDKECNALYRSYVRAPVRTESNLVPTFSVRTEEKKQERWEETVNAIDFSHSSRKAWRTINALTGRPRRSSRLRPVSANSSAWQLVKNGTHMTGARESSRLINKELSDLWKVPAPEGHSISDPFGLEKLAAAFRRMKPRKSPGLDSIFPKYILDTRPTFKSWFCDFLTFCMRQLKIPNIWRKALVVAPPKPEKPLGDPKSYHPISLQCGPFKIIERIIYAHVEPVIDPLLPLKQAGFQQGRSAIGSVTLLT